MVLGVEVAPSVGEISMANKMRLEMAGAQAVSVAVELVAAVVQQWCKPSLRAVLWVVIVWWVDGMAGMRQRHGRSAGGSGSGNGNGNGNNNVKWRGEAIATLTVPRGSYGTTIATSMAVTVTTVWQ